MPDIKYYEDIPFRDGCDCPFPLHQLHNNPKLGRAVCVMVCCMAVKLGGGAPTFNGVPITEFVINYEYTHRKATTDEQGVETVPEYAVADHEWNPDEDMKVVDAVPEDTEDGRSARPAIFKKKGQPPEWLAKRLKAKGLGSKLA